MNFIEWVLAQSDWTAISIIFFILATIFSWGVYVGYKSSIIRINNLRRILRESVEEVDKLNSYIETLEDRYELNHAQIDDLRDKLSVEIMAKIRLRSRYDTLTNNYALLRQSMERLKQDRRISENERTEGILNSGESGDPGERSNLDAESGTES